MERLAVLFMAGGVVLVIAGMFLIPTAPANHSLIWVLAGIACLLCAIAAGVWRLADILQDDRATGKAKRRRVVGEAPLYEILEQR